MRFLLFAVFFGCGGTITTGGDASTNDAASDVIPDAGFTSVLSFTHMSTGGQFVGEFFATAAQANGGCQTIESGRCSFVTCPAVAPPTFANAGTLSLQVGTKTFTASQSTSNTYFLSPITWAPADALMVSNSGADVPKFSAQITSPAAITIPLPPSSISTSQDLTVTWSDGENGASVAVGISRQGFNESLYVSCAFDATAGTGTVSKALLSQVQSGSPNGELVIGQFRRTTVTAGTFVINLSAIESQGFPVTFQ